MYTFKLLDIVVQGFAFLTAIILLMTFGVYGYFYWIKVGIIGWILLSTLLNLIVFRPLSSIRKITSIFVTIITVAFGLLLFFSMTISQLNFYFEPLSYFIIVGYFVISIMELNQLKKRGEIDLDF